MPAKRVDGIEQVDDPFLFCRIQHLFDFVHDFDIEYKRNRIVGWKRQYRCLRCGAPKVELIDETGTVLRSKIEYPDGYLVTGGRVRKSEVRREQMARMGYRFSKRTEKQ